jgi:protein gp37
MSQTTGIEWTDATWNPVRGCSKVSAGCAHCYAETVAARFSGPGQPYAGLVDEKGRWNGTVRLIEDHLEDPLRWKKPRRIFVNSMSDLFHESLSDQDIARVVAVMSHAPQHTFQVLTKRPKRMQAFMSRVKPLPNLWLGVSVEDQAAANRRIPLLIRTPAAVRFLSCEPLLGPVNLDPTLCGNCGGDEVNVGEDGTPWCPMCDDEEMGSAGWLDPDGIGWVIVGGESGHNARPMHPTWARSLRDQCARNEVPFFFKQWGEWVTGSPTDSERHRHEIDLGIPPVWPTWIGDAFGSVRGGPAPEQILRRVGKKTAGRVLDGLTHDGFPVPA